MKIARILLLLILGISTNLFAQESYNSLLHQGNTAFNNKNYDKSSAKFMEAVKSKEKDFDAHYNLGNSFYKEKKYEEARAEFDKAEKLASTIPDKMAAQYNLGNTYMETQQPDKAAEYYKKALKQDPQNEASQRNYQIAKLKQKQKEEQNKQGGKSGGNDGNKDNGKDPKDGKGDQPKQQNGKGGDPNTKGSGENGNEENEEDSKNKMPKELEKAILNRSENNERETARRILNKNADAMPQSNEKDW